MRDVAVPLDRTCWLKHIVGLIAMCTALSLLERSVSLPLMFASAFLFICCVTDTFLGEIPNPLVAVTMISGLIYHLATQGVGGISTSLFGLLLGGLLLALPYLLGGIGGGDVKALGALGALLGPKVVFMVFVFSGLAGGILAILYYLASSSEDSSFFSRMRLVYGTGDWTLLRPSDPAWNMRIPYAAAFVFGLQGALLWGMP